MVEKFEEKSLLRYLNNLLQDKNLHRSMGSGFWEWVMENRQLFGIGEETEVEALQGLTKRRSMDMENRGLFQQKAGMDYLRGATVKRMQSMRAPKYSSLEKTIRGIAGLFQLSECEQDFFALLVRIKKYGYLKELTNVLCGERRSNFSNLEYMDVCCRLTGMSLESAATVICKDGRLLNCGLIEYEQRQDRFDLSRRMSSIITQSLQLQTPAEVKAYLTGPQQQPSLGWEEFNYLGRDRELLEKIVGTAAQFKEKGINILLYGKPGTGKTEFCKTLVKRLGLSLYAVAETDSFSDEPSRKERLQSLRMLQSLFDGGTGNCILLDEAEDIFGNETSIKPQSKVYMNRQLETNPVPVFWLTNSTRNIDPAMIRRMTYCLEFSGLPTEIEVQMSLWECKKQSMNVEPTLIAGIAAEFKPSPALFSSAVRAARLAGGGEAEIRNVIEHTQKLLGGKRHAEQHRREFSMELLNTSVDLEKIAEAVKQKGNMNFSFCLYGPPGTGKSEYARWLAAQLGLPVLFKRASDLSSKWVGETEKNIAAAFSEAQDRKQLLVFDEADSLLHNRREARTSWEITHVNEMLTWMERHPYPFICTTNFCEKLDEAAFRRFTFKVKFDYLTKTQIKAAFHTFFELEAPNEALGMPRLTPSDFAVVKKKAEYLETVDVQEFVSLLKQETSVKAAAGTKNTIGFLADYG